MTMTDPRVTDAQLLALPLGYESMTAKQVVDLLPTMDKGGRTAARSYEVTGPGRATVIQRLDQLSAAEDRAASRTLDSTPPPSFPAAPSPSLSFELRTMPDTRRLGLLVLSAGVLASVGLVIQSGAGF
jgi:hypothetical protein